MIMDNLMLQKSIINKLLRDTANKSLYAIRVYANSKLRYGDPSKAKIITDALFDKKPNASIIDLLGKLIVEGNIDEAIKLRTKSSRMFKEAGNKFKSSKFCHG